MKVFELSYDSSHYQISVASTNEPPYKGYFTAKGLEIEPKTKKVPIPDFTVFVNPFWRMEGEIKTGQHIFSKRSWDALEDLLRPECKLMVPIKMRGFGNTLFYSVQIGTTLDAFNSEKSNANISADGTIMWIYEKEGVFFPEIIGNHHIFNLTNGAYHYVTDTFYERVKEHKFTGFRFRLLWED